MKINDYLRAIAGSLVLASVALGYWVHPAFFLFTAFVGLNLLQLGLHRPLSDDGPARSARRARLGAPTNFTGDL